MNDVPLPTTKHGATVREITLVLRAWFDAMIDGLSIDALRLLREECRRAKLSSANVEIMATIDRRLAQLRANPPRGS